MRGTPLGGYFSHKVFLGESPRGGNVNVFFKITAQMKDGGSTVELLQYLENEFENNMPDCVNQIKIEEVNFKYSTSEEFEQETSREKITSRLQDVMDELKEDESIWTSN